jgi:hypothetical protein
VSGWLWILVPILGSVIFSYLYFPIFLTRYLIVVLPALLILAASGFTGLPKLGLIAAIAVGASMAAATLGNYYSQGSFQDWRGAGRYFATHAAPGDVALTIPFAPAAFEYYATRSEPPPGVDAIPPWGITDPRAFLAPRSRIWIVSLGTEAFDRIPGLQRVLERRYTVAREVRLGEIEVSLYVRSPAG